MSTTDPFLPEQPASRDAHDSLQPEDFDADDEREPDVFTESDADDDVADDESPPVRSSVFRTPSGDAVDPTQDI